MVPPDVNAVLVVCGPTGSGKGSVARELARRLDGEVISADSRKIYRGFDIGTAKASAENRRVVRHHLVDVCAPSEVFTTGRFMELADLAIADIASRGRLPIVAGGTGLYLRTLLHGIVEAPPRDEALRATLLADEDHEPGALRRKLERVDPEAAELIPAPDLVRTVRALEVYALTGRKLSDMQDAHGFQPIRYRALQVAPAWPREDLYARIDARVDRMMQTGWLEEVKSLTEAGHAGTPAFQSVGYRQLSEHLNGKRTLEDAVASIKTEHRRYARRQLVWFRADPEIRWLPTPVDVDELEAEGRRYISEAQSATSRTERPPPGHPGSR